MRLRNLIPCNAKLKSYEASIEPHLTYCHLLWKFCKSSDSRKIECIQERALRAVYKSQAETYKEPLTLAKLPTLYNRRLQDIAILIYKVKYGMGPRLLRFDTVASRIIRRATKDLLFVLRSVVS